MTINGQDALNYSPPTPPGKQRQKKPPRVSYTRRFEEIEAYTAMGLTAREYEDLPGTAHWANGGLCKCDVVMWWKYHVAIENLRTGIF